MMLVSGHRRRRRDRMLVPTHSGGRRRVVRGNASGILRFLANDRNEIGKILVSAAAVDLVFGG